MGAPKQKWTEEEEAALRAGIRKHGTGKWRTILSDSEFSATLRSRSNVDLKDKWRNINASALWGSRQRGKLGIKWNQPTQKREVPIAPPKDDENALALIHTPPCDEEVVEVTPIATSTRSTGGKRWDNLILEAISTLKDPNGSDRASIASYIEESLDWNPANLKKLLASELKLLTANGTLTKIKHKYRIASSPRVSEVKKSLILALEERQKDTSNSEKEIKLLTKDEVDAELSKMRNMTAEEAAAAAARAVAEAEYAIAEAEEAAREAEAAEAEAEAAQIFARAAEKALKSRMLMTCCILRHCSTDEWCTLSSTFIIPRGSSL